MLGWMLSSRASVSELESATPSLASGRIGLASNDPRDAPVIEANMLGHEADVKALASGAQFAMQIFASKPLKSHFDGCFVPSQPLATREEFEAWLPKVAVPAYHPAGTCRMGCEGQAVVDSSLKVFGMDNLFVVDASVIAAPISGNMQAATMMIAHKKRAGGWPRASNQVEISNAAIVGFTNAAPRSSIA